MSNSKNNTKLIPVDIVDKIYFILNLLSDTITDWDLDKSWPCNFINDSINLCIEYFEPYVSDPL